MDKEHNFVPAQHEEKHPALSGKDEYMPNGYIGMYSLLRNPKNKTIFMGETHCQKIRKETFESILKIYNKYGTPSYANFFNYYAEEILEIGLNGFATIGKIAPIAHLIQCFGKEIGRNTVISFGIDKTLLLQYTQTGCVPVVHKQRPASRDLIIFGAERVNVDNKNTVEIERNALYRRFDEWCQIQGVDIKEGVLMAIDTLLQAYPVEKLKDTAAYDFLTEFDKPLFARPKKQAEKIKRTIELSGFICATAEKIIDRYNRDTANIHNRIDFNKYINNALYFLNNNIDLKYRNPEMYLEQKETEELTEYNKGGE